tara:strand:+ start:219 stop:374 length:156 start_codon:yes stop_codon:yes gene_type:complete
MKYSLKYLRDLTEKLCSSKCPFPKIDVKEIIKNKIREKVEEESEKEFKNDG